MSTECIACKIVKALSFNIYAWGRLEYSWKKARVGRHITTGWIAIVYINRGEERAFFKVSYKISQLSHLAINGIIVKLI